MINDELLEFYKEELVSLKEKLMFYQQANSEILKQQETLERQNSILKENNDSLSEMFTQYKEYTQNSMSELELQLANLSVERADKELRIDTLLQEIRALKRAQRESIVSDFDQQQRQLDSPDNLSQVSVDEFNSSFQKQKSLDLKQDSLIYLKKSFHTPQKNSKPDIQLIIENIPRSSYTILYEEEMKKIKVDISIFVKDISNKQFEMKIWQEKVISLFDEKYKNQKVLNEKLKELLTNSYPEEYRGKIWPFLIGNQLQMNKALYEKLLQSIPNHPLITQELLTLINNDLQRTFSIINDFEDADKLKDDLREILIIFHIYRPDVGYVQGMTYIAFMFLIRMSKQKTLKCFSNLIFKSQLLRTFYQFKSHYLDAYFFTFDFYFKEKLPQLATKFSAINLPKQSFLVEWYYTIFARAFNLITSSKIWDYFLCEGDSFLIRLTLAILAILEPDLLKCEYEDILMFIRQKTYQVSSGELFKSLQKIKIESKQFQARLQKQLDEL